MINMNKLWFILPIVIIAGCIGGGTTPVTPSGLGLEITDFSGDLTEVTEARTYRLTLGVENQGSTTVEKEKSLILLIAPSGWTINSASGANLLSDDRTALQFSRNMRPADVARGVEADVANVRWTLTAPDIAAGLTVENKFFARVYYDYSTTTFGTFWVYAESEANIMRDQGQALQKFDFNATQGPLKVNVRVAPDPVIVSESTELYTLIITLENVGDGVVFRSGNIPTDGSAPDLTDSLNKLDLTIEIDGDETGCSEAQDIELVRGQSVSINCDFIADKPAAKNSHTVSVAADYGYFTEQSTSVNVLGK